MLEVGNQKSEVRSQISVLWHLSSVLRGLWTMDYGPSTMSHEP